VKTINDVNVANRAMWDSGEFRHEDAWPESASRAAEKGAPFKQAVGPLTKAQTEYGEKRKKDLRSIGINPTEGEIMNRRAIIARHPENDTSSVIEDVNTEDVRHPKKGASQQVMRGEQVVAQHDDISERMEKSESDDRSGANIGSEQDPKKVSKRAAHGPSEENWRGVTGAHKPIGGLSGTSAGTHFPPELKNKSEDDAPKRQVHLPRTSKRTWRRGEWS
jgi:hypothetical protein